MHVVTSKPAPKTKGKRGAVSKLLLAWPVDDDEDVDGDEDEDATWRGMADANR